jgi:hypothetical protein
MGEAAAEPEKSMSNSGAFEHLWRIRAPEGVEDA